jgi:hypothetical protein
MSKKQSKRLEKEAKKASKRREKVWRKAGFLHEMELIKMSYPVPKSWQEIAMKLEPPPKADPADAVGILRNYGIGKTEITRNETAKIWMSVDGGELIECSIRDAKNVLTHEIMHRLVDFNHDLPRQFKLELVVGPTIKAE